MAIDPDFLAILVCPENHQPLAHASADVIAELNARIVSGGVTTVGGRALDKPLAAGLVREAGDRIYMVVDDIPVLLAEEAVAL